MTSSAGADRGVATQVGGEASQTQLLTNQQRQVNPLLCWPSAPFQFHRFGARLRSACLAVYTHNIKDHTVYQYRSGHKKCFRTDEQTACGD
eukprot:6100903-Amphidinium_carterae.1